MIFMLGGRFTTADAASEEMGCQVEHMLSPDGLRYPPEKGWFCADNGAFKKFDPKLFGKMLQNAKPAIDRCRFVCVPDVVGSARRTLECFDHWENQMVGWPLAFVAQDGQENLPIPWNKISALFVGGSTDWKLGPNAAACVKAAKIIGKWVHVGRVNTPGRFEYFENLGADSCDGMGLTTFTSSREAIFKRKTEPCLFDKLNGEHQ